MARVYLAESLNSGLLRKLVVLKVLNQELAADPEMREAFIREAEISARLNHPNIVNVHEVFEQGNTPVMVMQYLEGMALSDVISRLQGQIPLKLYLNILCQVLDALHYFHELKGPNGEPLECVHRDVSPHNVMVLHEGGIKVVDFGVAKVRAQSDSHTRTGVIKGKVAYMPPEQLLSCATVDRRADIYSVGVMLWEAVAGRRMWRGMDSSSRLRAIVRGEVPDIREAAPGVSDAIVKIIKRALAPTPDGRYATAEEMQIELEQVTLTEGGYSLPRELAEFMRVHFGEERREKQRAIEKAIKDPDHSVADVSWSASEVAKSGIAAKPTLPAESSTPEGSASALSAPEVVVTPPQRSRRALVGAALAALLCVGAGAMLLSDPAHPQASEEQQAQASESSVMLRVASDPPGAEVYLDGVKLGVTPLVQPRPASAQDSTLELRAEGRVTQSKVVRLEADVTLDVALPKEGSVAERAASHETAAESDQERATSAEAKADEQRQALSRQRRPPPRPVSAARTKGGGETATPEATAPASAAAKEAAPADNCDPPYRLDPGGVKVFKPHCF